MQLIKMESLTKQKEEEQKKIALCLHSSQNSCNSLNRLIVEFKKHHQELTTQISSI
jgi:hypothetical protein